MTSGPRVSVIMPVHNGGDQLTRALAALMLSDLRRDDWELVVVDDGSTDDSASTASLVASTVVRLPGPPRGPAYARNRGVEVARGEYFVFVDADVAVHVDTLRRLVETLTDDPSLAAVFGSFDNGPQGYGFVSQYWNLLQAYGCWRHDGEAWTFGSGCGAIRRTALAAVSGFDEWHFQQPLIEDLELGTRLRESGERVLLRADILSTHLKHWTLPSIVKDAWRRGVALGRLLGYSGALHKARSDVLHTLASTRGLLAGATALIVLNGARTLGAGWTGSIVLAIALAALVNSSVHGFMLKRRGLVFTIGAAPLHLVVAIISGIALSYGWLLRHLLGEPSPDPTTQAFAEVGVRTWPPIPRPRN